MKISKNAKDAIFKAREILKKIHFEKDYGVDVGIVIDADAAAMPLSGVVIPTVYMRRCILVGAAA